ncbi:gpW family head-tail joining protein [Sediminimonas qiaohouensis]|uniref:gpW family head-tail joining protein n=1 Tax=Sediminimonas qiaohouensis TaxID=552061 RepID=UPI00040B7AB7|nr:gpW family head-tail joining protein [Sediminimonas qiaohouensis]
MEDPCQEAIDLRKIKRDLVTGREVSSTRFGEDEVRFTKADLGRLDAMIADADRQCAIQSGERPKRTRFAKGVRFRPY